MRTQIKITGLGASQLNHKEHNKALIPNTQLEEMFLRVATDGQMTIYLKHIKSSNTGLATSYASDIVHKKFFQLIRKEEAYGTN